MPSDNISVEEWLAALQEAEQPDKQSANVWSVRDLMTKTGRGERWVKSRIRAGLDAGILCRAQKQIIDMAGRSQRIAAYALKKKGG